jgi:hypothetical protein
MKFRSSRATNPAPSIPSILSIPSIPSLRATWCQAGGDVTNVPPGSCKARLQNTQRPAGQRKVPPCFIFCNEQQNHHWLQT